MKFNVLSRQSSALRNHEGAQAWALRPEVELYAAVVTATLSDKFYEGQADRIGRIQTLIGKVPPEFVAKLAVYAREKMYLRSIPLVLAVELAKQHQGDDLVRKLVARIVQRADEITELLACYQSANQRTGVKKLGKLSKQIQKGLADAFNKFDEYQFAKYNRAAEVKLRDALFLVHPKAKDAEQQTLFDKIAEDKLETAYTWESELSKAGQAKFEDEDEKAAAFGGKWAELIASGRLGYMALLRNLRNILTAQVSDDHLRKVMADLCNPQAVRKAKQYPFRFLSAYRELQALDHPMTPQVLEALEQAVLASVDNIAGFDDSTRVFVACDVSSSMYSPVSAKSTIGMYDIGLVLGMLLQAKCKQVTTSIFGDTHKVVQLPRGQVLSNAMALRAIEGSVGYATNGWKVIAHLIDKRQIVDKVMLFTDVQLYDSAGTRSFADEWKAYRKLAPNAKLYLFDLQGYGHAPLEMKDDGVFLVAGWSEKVFEVMAAIERGEDVLSAIEAVTL
jgi:60 kDa SS-A/Ro ribonucleoprotein